MTSWSGKRGGKPARSLCWGLWEGVRDRLAIPCSRPARLRRTLPIWNLRRGEMSQHAAFCVQRAGGLFSIQIRTGALSLSYDLRPLRRTFRDLPHTHTSGL